MTNENTISTINNLIETCKDGQEGFKVAAEGVETSELKTTFYDLSQQRSKFAGELQSLVREMGGEPEDSASFSGTIHRGWINIKSAITGQDETAILNECERGEDSAIKQYKEALKEELPANAEEAIRRQYKEIQTASERVKALRNTSRGASA